MYIFNLFYLLHSYNPRFLICLCFNMVSFSGKKKLGPRPDRSPLGGFIQNFRRASPPLSYAEFPPGESTTLPPPKLESLLILKPFFQCCQWIFLNLSMSKAEKTHGHVYSQTSTNGHPSTLGTSLQQPLFLSRRTFHTMTLV